MIQLCHRRWAFFRSVIVAVLFAIVFAQLAEAEPTTHPGWPITYRTPGAVDLYDTSVDVVDLMGDGSRRVVIAWNAIFGQSPPPMGSIEFRRENGIVDRRIDYERVFGKLAYVDRDDDGAYEIVAPRGTGIAMFGADGALLWDHSRIDGDPTWGYLTAPFPSIAELDGDGKPWVVATTNVSAIYVFDMNGNLRSGFPITNIDGPFDVPPTIVDLDGDGKPEIVIGGDSSGHIFCFKNDAMPCPGSWPYVFTPNGYPWANFSGSPLPAYTGADGFPYFAASTEGRQIYPPPPYLHVIDRFGQPVAPYPVALPYSYIGGSRYTRFEADGKAWWALAGSYGDLYVFDFATGIEKPGWPVQGTIESFCDPAVADLGEGGPVGLMFGGTNSGGQNQMMVDSYDVSGAHLSGYPRVINRPWDYLRSITINTLDGVNTTACWTTDRYGGDSSQCDCFDLGVPWDRGKVQWGDYAFDLKRTSRFRRLWQIDRNNTCLTTPVSEVPSNTGQSFDVTVCPRDKNNAPLGPDQEVRFARRPILGQFVGPVRYDAASGNYTRTYQAPVQDASADIEFRVFVNEELDDTMPVVHLRGGPKITAWSPDGVPRGGVLARTTIALTGTDFTATPTVHPTTSDLVLVSFTLTSPTTIGALVRAPSNAKIGWSGLQVTASDGRTSNVAPIFVYDPEQTTLIATKPAASATSARLEWFGGSPSSAPSWKLERASTPTFATATTIYQGPQQAFTDATAAAPVLFYRVK